MNNIHDSEMCLVTEIIIILCYRFHLMKYGTSTRLGAPYVDLSTIYNEVTDGYFYFVLTCMMALFIIYR